MVGWLPIRPLAWVHLLTPDPQVSPSALSQTLEFLYTGRLPTRASLHLADLDKVPRRVLSSLPAPQVGALLEVPHLLDFVANMRNKEDFLNSEVTEQMVATISHQLEDVILGRRLFSDIEVTSSIGHHYLPIVCSGRWEGGGTQAPADGAVRHDAGDPGVCLFDKPPTDSTPGHVL